MTLILWMLFLTVGACIAVLVTPTLICLSVTSQQRLDWRIDVRFLGGITPTISLHKAQRSRRSDRRKAKPSKPQRRRAMPTGRRRDILRAAPRLVAETLGSVTLTRLRVDCDFGTGDPADTGRLCGLLMPLQHAAPLPAATEVFLRPDFTKRRFSGDIAADFRVTFAALILPLLQFGWRSFGPGDDGSS
jgi:hypothetical protein